MKLTLTLKYNTVFGQEIAVNFDGNIQPMQWKPGNLWSAELDLAKGEYEYSYLLLSDGNPIRKEATVHILQFESDCDRWDWWQDREESYYKSISSAFGEFGTRVAGLAVPVFSLRSSKSFGVGEFTDLKLLVDFAASCGMRCIQLLPINDTSVRGDWQDSYPYSACSSFALHPQFLNLEMAGVEADTEFNDLRERLNALDCLDYEQVNSAKDRYLRARFAQIKAKVEKDKAFKAFVEKNRYWLLPYACFRNLTLEKLTPDFTKWDNMAKYSDAKVEKYYAGHKDEVNYYMWVQFHLDKQLSEVVTYARSKDVHFKGDLPIGVGRFSSDSWQHSDLFNMDSCAGAPPDFFSRDGQNWGFPTYNWDVMAKDGYRWWRERLGKMGEYFDAYRIDHILGFFRIWEIPYNWDSCSGSDVSGLYGHFNPALPYSAKEIEYFDYAGKHLLFLEDPHKPGFYNPKIGAYEIAPYRLMDQDHKRAFDELYKDYFYHRHNQFWKELSIKKLGALTGSSKMLACGEDLGMMADCVPEVMDMYNILSLEMPRMPKRLGEEFSDSCDYSYLSVCTSGTHDMSPFRLWWIQSPEQAQHYYTNVLGMNGQAPSDLTPEVCTEMLRKLLKSPSMLCVIPLQDWLASSWSLRVQDESKLELERINDPSNGHHYWRYRMNVNIEDMLADGGFTDSVRQMISESQR